jgi:hypothetical protein
MMTDRLEPALSEEEWARVHDGTARWAVLDMAPEVQRKMIALANAALPDDDPRKITWEMVTVIREAAHVPQHDGATWEDERVTRIADTLESYLPPK